MEDLPQLPKGYTALGNPPLPKGYSPVIEKKTLDGSAAVSSPVSLPGGNPLKNGYDLSPQTSEDYNHEPAVLTEKGKQDYNTTFQPSAFDATKATVHQSARALGDLNKQRPSAEDKGILDKISQGLYMPALNQGFNEVITKPVAGATDFLDRTIDKAYTTLTGEKTPSWLRKGGAFDKIVSHYEAEYQKRDKPSNLVSEIAESTAGTIPLMAALATGGEANILAHAPETVGKLAGYLGATGLLNGFKDATDAGKGYSESVKEATLEGGNKAMEGAGMEAQLLLGGAFGKKAVKILEDKGIDLNKSGEAILHALGLGTVFAGTSAGDDLVQGKDIDTRNVAKQMGMGLAFGIIPIAQGIGEDLKGDHEAAQAGAVAGAASSLNAESALRTLVTTPKEQVEAIRDLPGSKDKLYAGSIESGIKAFDAKNPEEKRANQTDQLIQKAQGDIKLIADKVEENYPAIVEAINSSTELPAEQKADLLEKIEVLRKPIDEEVSAPVLAKAEDDLTLLKKSAEPVKKYEASMKRLTDAKNNGKISENDFTAVKQRFDDVMSEHILKEIKEEPTDAVQEPGAGALLQSPQEGTGETGSERPGVEPVVQGDEVAQAPQSEEIPGGEEKVKPFIAWHEGFGKDTQGDAVYFEGEEAAKTSSDKAKPYRVSLEKPFIVKTDTDFEPIKEIVDAVRAENPQAKWHPDITSEVNRRLKEQGYDGLIIEPSAFETEKGYTEIGGTYGDPQTVVFDKSKIEEIAPAESAPPKSSALQPKDKVTFINQLKEPDTGEIIANNGDGTYKVMKSNGVANNIDAGKLTKVEDSPDQVIEGAMMPMGVLPYTKEFIEHDVAPLAKKAGSTVKDILKWVVNTLSPKTGVDPKATDTVMKALGGRTEAAAMVDKVIGSFEKTFDKMPDAERIAFIDKMKRGQKQPTPELQDIADAISKLDKDLYDQITEYKPNLNWKENHFRVLWKTVPGKAKERFFGMMMRRPLAGTKGFLKKATLADMSEGIAKGGVPQSTNPVTMFKVAYNDGMKFITAHRMIEALKKDKLIKFVKKGGDVPEGFVPINDRIANVYFNKDGMIVGSGDYYAEEGAGRLLNNYLSEDYLRKEGTGTGAIGRSLMGLKNLYTQIELSLSGFHAIAEGLESVSSQLGLGLRKLVNLGFGKGNIREGASGIMDMLKAPFSPKTTFSLGRKGIRYATEKDFENSPLGKSFIQKMPDAKEYLHDFFNGGGLLKQHEDLRLNTYKALKDQMGKSNYIGSALRALPAMNEVLLDPLFNHYIPALKVGMFLKEYPTALKENSSRLAKGDISREQLARKTVDFIDDRLGEMNFDNLFWDRTFKTAMQMMFRSVTWKLGNLRAMAGAPAEQGMEFLDAFHEKRAPMLMPKMAWLFGLTASTVALAQAVQYGFTGKNLATLKDVVAPQINPDDDKERVVVPTYYKDMLHLWHSPGQYISSSMSGPFSKTMDIWNNKDFYNYEIHDENDPVWQKRKDDLVYFIPKPFSVTSASQMLQHHEKPAKVVMSFLGLNKAPGYLVNTDMENAIFDLHNIRNLTVKPKAQVEGDKAKKEIRALYREGKIAEAQKVAKDAVHNGLLRTTQTKYLFSRAKKGDNASVFLFKELPYSDKLHLFGQMTEEEKKLYVPSAATRKQFQKETDALK